MFAIEPLNAEIARLEKLPLEHLEHEIAELSSHLQAGMCRWLELVAEFDRRDGWGSWGCTSCADWVAWRCAVAPRAAREHVRVARALVELPEIHAAFSRGELSYSKVRALTRVATPACEDELVEMSRHATAAQLERICRGLRRVMTDEAERVHQDRYLTHFWDPEDGALCIHARIPADDGGLVLAALEAASDRLWEDQRGSAEPDATSQGPEAGSAEPGASSGEGAGGSAEPPPREPRRGPTKADALVEIAQSSLGRGPDEVSGRRSAERYQVVLHVDVATLSRDREGTCELDDSVALSPETARRLACDATVVELIESDGEPLGVGRRSRRIPARLRRALEARDRRCTFPGCQNTRLLESHHLEHWARGGSTDADNLTRLCRFHHHLCHEGGFTAERLKDGRLRFRRPDGVVIACSPPPPRGDPDALERAESSVGGGLLVGGRDRLDLGLAIDGLAARSARAATHC